MPEVFDLFLEPTTAVSVVVKSGMIFFRMRRCPMFGVVVVSVIGPARRMIADTMVGAVSFGEYASTIALLMGCTVCAVGPVALLSTTTIVVKSTILVKGAAGVSVAESWTNCVAW